MLSIFFKSFRSRSRLRPVLARRAGSNVRLQRCPMCSKNRKHFFIVMPNTTVKSAPSGRWTLLDKAQHSPSLPPKLNIMSEHITHEVYVSSVRKQVVDIAKSILNRKMSFFEGARLLSSLRHEAPVHDYDADLWSLLRLIQKLITSQSGRFDSICRMMQWRNLILR